MPCGCGKKNNVGTIHFMGRDSSQIADPQEWGPVLWKFLHCLSEKIGTSNNKILDADQAVYMESMINTLHLIIPCTECQAHAASYISTNPLPTLKGLQGETLRNTLRTWLLAFHNHVRNSKGQPIIINNLEEYSAMYGGCFVPKCEHTLFVQSVAYAVRQGWVRIDNWRKWYSSSERLRIIAGNIIQ